MKKFFKGCLFTIGIIFFVAVLVFIYFINKPNEIDFLESPISNSEVKRYTDFPGVEIPSQILNAKTENVIYQSLIIDDGLDRSVTYIILIQNCKDVDLQNLSPINDNSIQKINNKISFRQIIDNKLTARVSLSQKDEETIGREIKIFSNINNEDATLRLKKSYLYTDYKELDKNGSVSDIIIYDKSKNYLLFERHRYFAFQ